MCISNGREHLVSQSLKEFGKRCGICNKRRESRMYRQKIKGKYRRICKECWASQEATEGTCLSKESASEP